MFKHRITSPASELEIFHILFQNRLTGFKKPFVQGWSWMLTASDRQCGHLNKCMQPRPPLIIVISYHPQCMI